RISISGNVRLRNSTVLSVNTVLTVITPSTIARDPSRWCDLARTSLMQWRVTNSAAHRKGPVGSVGVQGLALQSESPPDPYHFAVQLGTVGTGLTAGRDPAQVRDASLLVTQTGHRVAQPNCLPSGDFAGT